MPLKQLPKRGSADALGNSSDGTNVFKKAALFKVSPNGDIKTNGLGVFLLNPATYEDSKSAKWVDQETPGQSDPPMQWVASGPRTVSFESLVTVDTSDFDEVKQYNESFQALADAANQVINVLGDAAAKFAGISTPPPRIPVQQHFGKNLSLDISPYLNYYRSMLYPEYDKQFTSNPRKLSQSPPLLVLYAGSSIIKRKYEKRITSQHDLWVLTDLKIRITKQLPNLAPMEAVVQFTLKQYNIRSFDSRRFTV